MLVVTNEAGDRIWHDQLPDYFWIWWAHDVQHGVYSGVMQFEGDPEVYRWVCDPREGDESQE